LTVYRLGGIVAAMDKTQKETLQKQFEELNLAWKRIHVLAQSLKDAGVELEFNTLFIDTCTDETSFFLDRISRAQFPFVSAKITEVTYL